MPLSDIVNISITRQTQTVSRASFGIVMILGPNAPYTTERIKFYSSTSAMTDDGYDSADEEVVVAGKIFAQNPSVTQIATGRIDVGDATITDTLTAIKNENNTWYSIIDTEHLKADQLLIAAWVETNKKYYPAGSQEADIVDTTDGADTTSLAAVFKANAYARSSVFFHSSADTEYPEAGLIGQILPRDPGSYTAKFKTAASVAVDTLTDTQVVNAKAKSVNIYTEIGGVNIFQEGVVSAPEFIDTIIFVDWLEARIQESVYAGLVQNDKIPMTDGGFAIIEGLITEPLTTGQARGGISEFSKDDEGNQNGGFVVNVPRLQDVPAADRAARNLPDVTFTAWLAGAIHATVINGVVTV